MRQQTNVHMHVVRRWFHRRRCQVLKNLNQIVESNYFLHSCDLAVHIHVIFLFVHVIAHRPSYTIGQSLLISCFVKKNKNTYKTNLEQLVNVELLMGLNKFMAHIWSPQMNTTHYLINPHTSSPRHFQNLPKPYSNP